MGRIAVGLFGFGRTGSVVAQEIIKDTEFELRWVIRKSLTNEGAYASRLLGFPHEEGRIFSIEHLNFEKFYKDNMVDIIIDFSDSCSVNEYMQAAEYGIRIVSAISNYNEKEFNQLLKISRDTAVDRKSVV
jgi:4-hydroxy-tetrahydrodipicolinate reductase